jgi:hypothetical protein
MKFKLWKALQAEKAMAAAIHAILREKFAFPASLV